MFKKKLPVLCEFAKLIKGGIAFLWLFFALGFVNLFFLKNVGE